ncbi:MAG: DNA primase [Aerococcus sp.]|nr:DNA primase [Aerococcus sp.]
MPYIPEEIVTEIRQSVDIVDVVGQYVDLKKRGKNYFGLCPFHDENTPSFAVEGEGQFFKCFSCGRGGNVFTFLMELKGYSFTEAVQKVQEFGHVAVDYDFQAATSNNDHYSEEERQLLSIHQAVMDFYHYLLTGTEAGVPAMEYLNRRGLSTETIERFQIGLSPDEREMTYRYLISKNFTPDVINKAGIFVGQNQQIDRFHDRIMFPLRDVNGKAIGFSGRIWRDNAPSDQPKYLNSPETALFEKNRFLFNLDLAKTEAKKAKQLILFEGFMDVIKASEVGIHYGVASLGTSLTDHQIQRLYRHTKHLLIAYDGDRPGFEATKRAVEHIQSLTPHQNLQVALFPEDLDPDEFVERHGGERFQQFLQEQPLSVMQFYRAYYRQTYSLESDDGKVQYIQAMLSIIARESDPIKREIDLQDVSEDTDVNTEILANQLSLAQPSQKENPAPAWETTMPDEPARSHKKRSYTTMQRAELQLMNRLLKIPDTWAMVALEQEDFTFQTSIVQTLYILLSAYREEHPDFSAADFYSTLSGKAEQEWFMAAQQLELPAECTTQEIHDLMSAITVKARLNEKLQSLTNAINTAKLTNDIAKMGDLNQKRIEILRELKDNR